MSDAGFERSLGAVDNSLEQTEIVNFWAPYRSLCC